MNLRIILFVLALLAFLSASIGGALYYSSLRESALKEAERQAVAHADMVKKNFSAFLSESIRPAKTLAGMHALKDALIQADESNIASANTILDHFQETLNTDVCYLMDPQGNTIASSNRKAPDSFVGKNFVFRPYFQKAIKGHPATYLALGTTSGKRGAYYSHPIYSDNIKSPVGVVVIKVSIERIEKELGPDLDRMVLVTDPRGIVFISNRKDWLYQSLWKLTENDVSEIAESLQFGKGPWIWSGLEQKDEKHLVDRSGNVYLFHKKRLDNYPGWHVFELRDAKAISKRISDPIISVTGPIVLTLCILIGLSAFLLYRKASYEITQRKAFEKALLEGEERYRSLYHNTPGMLHSVDPEGRLLSVSDYWAEALGYQRDEVIGRKLSGFFTEDSRNYAEEKVLPEFLKTGYLKDISYQFVTKSGDVRDILLSAIGDRDRQGNVIRSLAVSIDVTERKRAEEALTQAKEALSVYSKDLERQVKKRTEEITSILRYTPAFVYIKDKEGHYMLVNSRYEELFGVQNEMIRGKTDHEVLPTAVADQFRSHDQKVISDNNPCQVEERIPQAEGVHTYLSVKFPVYDESGNISGVGGISTDITEVKKTQDQLRLLSGSIMDEQEKERSALARELHDELGQVLTALRIDSSWMLDRLKEIDPKSALRALSMCELIDKTIEEVRRMAFRLRPGVLDDLGLIDALEAYTTDFERRTGITCVFEHANVPNVSETLATAAYRIAQEALTNAARHAAASHIEVKVEAQNGNLFLNVVDNGKGFNLFELNEPEGFGLASMRERASLAGGELEIRSAAGEGTQIVCNMSIDGGMS
ncbi:MAG: PAS domain S-box protein [Deltaproteobacteria bacterium]|nr:PAS domain S-box protein [Deltaproteobacteria bacterium]